LSELYDVVEEKMKKAITSLQREFSTLRAGRASPALVERLEVDYYGTPTPLNQIAGISAPEPRLLVIQPWDKSSISNIEKTILKSDLGLNPINDGNVIRLNFPQLTEERRNELVKFVRKKAEESKVAIRNIRREANDTLKAQEKDGDLSEDEKKRSQDEIQKLTDKYIEEVDKVLSQKEKEIKEV